MIDGSRVLALIPARGGSRGVVGKNLRFAGGKPLISWTVAAALESRYVDRVVTSTDDEAIRNEAIRCGSEAPYLRPEALATDEATSVDVALDALERLPDNDYLVLLQPTSPLRTSADIDKAIEQCHRGGAPSCVSVRPAVDSPWWMFTITHGARLEPVLQGERATRRQDLPEACVLNGAVYVTTTESLRTRRAFVVPGTVAYLMPAERSLDIDTESDLAIADARLRTG